MRLLLFMMLSIPCELIKLSLPVQSSIMSILQLVMRGRFFQPDKVLALLLLSILHA